jgi:hypothetical protein
MSNTSSPYRFTKYSNKNVEVSFTTTVTSDVNGIRDCSMSYDKLYADNDTILFALGSVVGSVVATLFGVGTSVICVGRIVGNSKADGISVSVRMDGAMVEEVGNAVVDANVGGFVCDGTAVVSPIVGSNVVDGKSVAKKIVGDNVWEGKDVAAVGETVLDVGTGDVGTNVDSLVVGNNVVGSGVSLFLDVGKSIENR